MDIGYTDISPYSNVAKYCKFVKSLVPSFEENLMIANNSHNVCFVLSLSWTIVYLLLFLTFVVLLKSYVMDIAMRATLNKIKICINRIAVVNIVFVSFFLLMLMYRFYVPSDVNANGASGKLLVFLLRSGVLTSSIYGLIDIFFALLVCIGLIKFFAELVDIKDF